MQGRQNPKSKVWEVNVGPKFKQPLPYNPT